MYYCASIGLTWNIVKGHVLYNTHVKKSCTSIIGGFICYAIYGSITSTIRVCTSIWYLFTSTWTDLSSERLKIRSSASGRSALSQIINCSAAGLYILCRHLTSSGSGLGVSNILWLISSKSIQRLLLAISKFPSSPFIVPLMKWIGNDLQVDPQALHYCLEAN